MLSNSNDIPLDIPRYSFKIKWYSWGGVSKLEVNVSLINLTITSDEIIINTIKNLDHKNIIGPDGFWILTRYRRLHSIENHIILSFSILATLRGILGGSVGTFD